MQMFRETDAYFSRDYSCSRDKFLSAAQRIGLTHESFVNPLAGPQEAVLATDTVLMGRSDAVSLIVLISGTHGLEALAGSGIQVGLLDRLSINSLKNTAILFVHAINPWGAANRRRQNENNVDINRNFRCFADPPIENRFYELLHPIISVRKLFVNGIRNPEVDRQIAGYINEHGNRAFYAALFQGQSRFPNGVGFCGLEPAWSNRTIRNICKRFGASRKRIAVVDLHTGLGKHGCGTLMHSISDSKSDRALAVDWFGKDIISVHNDQSMPYVPKGDMTSALRFAFSDQATVIPVALEFGTYPADELMQLQIDDTWLQLFGDETSERGKLIKRELEAFFFPDSPQWRHEIFSQSEEIISNVIQALQH